MNRSPEYRLLDSGRGRKLEQAGPYRLIRPALNACWSPALPEKEWQLADAVFTRDSSGHGSWSYPRRPLPESWMMEWGGLTLKVKPTGFGHLGFFAEQYANWAKFGELIPKLGREPAALNLFAYSGLGSLAMAKAGAKVCHLDAARGMIEWGRENLELNPEIPDAVRWIVDDVVKFCKREVRRGSRYQLIALDPPSFGRGSQGQLWKIDDQIVELLSLCREITAVERPFAVFLSCHSPGFTPIALARVLEEVYGRGGVVEAGEMWIPEQGGRKLPAGICACFRRGC